MKYSDRNSGRRKKRYLLPITAVLFVLLTLLCACDASESGSETEDAAVSVPEVIPPESIPTLDAYQLCYTNGYTGRNDLPVSGWRYDNRGGAVQTTAGGGPGVLNDISTEYGTALIRDFNPESAGVFVTETSLEAYGDGVYLEYRDTEDKPIFRLSLHDGAWKLLSSDGSEQTILENALPEGSRSRVFRFRIVLDLTFGTASVAIDDTEYGTYPLLGASLADFRFATEEKAVTAAVPGSINITANYAVYEDYELRGTKKLHGWETEGKVSVSNGELTLNAQSSAQTAFAPVGGNVCAETWFLCKNAGAWGITLSSDEKTALSLHIENKQLCAGETVLADLRQNMWYRLRAEANGFSGNAVIYLDGREVGTVPLGTVLPVSSFAVCSDGGKALLDMTKVYGLVGHADYVPEPAVRASFDDYTVGINVCSLWREGHHWGWNAIAPYREPTPVLGYYDEGVPETADWEIKYMVEHGIDFQAFCWYADNADGPIKYPSMSEHLHDGYMFARYSDYMRYTLIWEASNGKHFDSAQFRDHVVPYWFENYFLDPRYLTLDNKLVLQIFGAEQLSDNTYFGSADNARAELDYLRETAKQYGFDGVIVMACGSRVTPTLEAMGIDAVYAYNWGSDGRNLTVNKNNILASAASSQEVYTVPTVSVGFDSIPWHGIRYGMMSTADYLEANRWVVSSYLPEYAEKGTWNESLVMLSTWNEYGEGTYIMPCEEQNGFGYLDVLRDVYTAFGAASESVDCVPNEDQRARINHLYPQDSHLLRAQGWYALETETDPSAYETAFSPEFSKANCSPYMISELRYEDGAISGVSDAVNNDPIIQFSAPMNWTIDDISAVRFTMQAPEGTSVVLYFSTDEEPNLSESKTIRFLTDTSETKEYFIKIDNALWKGTLKTLRIDPTTACSVPFRIEKIDFLRKAETNLPVLTINGCVCGSKIPAAVTENGEVLFPFDPGAAYDCFMNVFYTWLPDREGGTLTIAGNHHTVTFTVGSDRYLSDGEEKELPDTLYCSDGLPMLSYRILAEALGYTYENDGTTCSVKTPDYDRFQKGTERIPYQWEFNDTDTEGWNSSHMSLIVQNGVMKATSLTDFNDPILRNSEEIRMNAADFSTFSVRCRYDYDAYSEEMLTLYFITDKDSTWNEAKTLKFPLSSTQCDEFEEYVYDLSDQPLWQDTITDIRFDPFNAAGEMELDYIRFE